MRHPLLVLAGLTLQGLNVAGEVVDAHITQVAVLVDLVKDGAPDRHLAGAVRHRAFHALDDVANADAGEYAAGAQGDLGEVGHFDVERGGGWAVSLAVNAVTTGAVVAKKDSPIHAASGRIALVLRRTARREAEKRRDESGEEEGWAEGKRRGEVSHVHNISRSAGKWQGKSGYPAA